MIKNQSQKPQSPAEVSCNTSQWIPFKPKITTEVEESIETTPMDLKVIRKSVGQGMFYIKFPRKPLGFS